MQSGGNERKRRTTAIEGAAATDPYVRECVDVVQACEGGGRERRLEGKLTAVVGSVHGQVEAVSMFSGSSDRRKERAWSLP